MDTKQILYTSIIAVIASLVVVFGVGLFDGNVKGQGAAPGSRTIESMLPGVQQAGGILSLKPMWINGSTTLQGLLNVSGAFNLGGILALDSDLIVDTSDFIVDVSTGIVSIGTTTPDDVKTFQVDGGTATGTISADSSNELFGGCFEIKSMTASSSFFIVATTTGFPILQTGSCIGGQIAE